MKSMHRGTALPQLATTSSLVPPVLHTQRHCRQPVSRAGVEAPERVLEQQIAQPDEKLPPGLNRYSSRVTQPKAQGASQAMLYATGLSEEDMQKPQVCSKDISTQAALYTYCEHTACLFSAATCF